MSVCVRPKFNPDKSKYIQKYINTKVDIEETIPFGFTSSVNRNGDVNIYTYGKRDIEKKLPFESDSIYRMASQSKFMAVTGFLKLLDKKLVNWDTAIKEYIPEYSKEKMGVIEPYEPNGYEKTLMNPLNTSEKSNIIHVRHLANPFKNGDVISLEWSNGSLDIAELSLPDINGISGFEVFNIHVINNVDENGYDITVTSKAKKNGETGGFMKIKEVDSDCHRSICLTPDTILIKPKVATYYYKLIPLKRELTILDVINHGLGWSYYASAMLYMSFGYAKDPLKRDIQAGIWNELGLPVGLPLSCYKCGIKNWAKLAAKIPLLYQPGEDWSYGPQISILGSLIELIDGRPVEKYMKEELWDPLKMKNTGFFIHDDDPLYHDKVDRISKLYVNMPKMVIKIMGNDILNKFPLVCEAQHCMYEGPRSLPLMDSGMYTTAEDYIKFMKMYLDGGKSEDATEVLSEQILKNIRTYQTCYDVSNLSTVDGYSSGLSISMSTESDIKRQRLLTSMRWGLGTGTILGCKNNPYNENGDENILAITWAGVLGTRFLIDFCSGVAYNAGTNVIGPPAGTFDSDLIELNYKNFDKNKYKNMVMEMMMM